MGTLPLSRKVITLRELKKAVPVPSCKLEIGKAVVGLTPCIDSDPYGCPEQFHRVFTGTVELQGHDGQWLVSGIIKDTLRWWYGSFQNITITTQDATDANELWTCSAHMPLPVYPLSSEGSQSLARQLIGALKITTEGGGFERMDYCSECGKLKADKTVFLSSEEADISDSSLLLPQHAKPIRQMLRSTGGLCLAQC